MAEPAFLVNKDDGIPEGLQGADVFLHTHCYNFQVVGRWNLLPGDAQNPIFVQAGQLDIPALGVIGDRNEGVAISQRDLHHVVQGIHPIGTGGVHVQIPRETVLAGVGTGGGVPVAVGKGVMEGMGVSVGPGVAEGSSVAVGPRVGDGSSGIRVGVAVETGRSNSLAALQPARRMKITSKRGVTFFIEI